MVIVYVILCIKPFFYIYYLLEAVDNIFATLIFLLMFMSPKVLFANFLFSELGSFRICKNGVPMVMVFLTITIYV